MKRSKLWTFIFSFCPGAGQMYQGYMKRGLSLILMFVLPLMLGAGFMPVLGALAAVAYMYSFFDSLNLSAQIQDGMAPKDEYLINMELSQGDLQRLLSGKNHLIGWGFVGLGVIGLYKSLLEPMLRSLIELLPRANPLRSELMQILYAVPGIAVGVLFILVGLWLVNGGKKKPNDFQEYKGDDHD